MTTGTGTCNRGPEAKAEIPVSHLEGLGAPIPSTGIVWAKGVGSKRSQVGSAPSGTPSEMSKRGSHLTRWLYSLELGVC